MRKLRADAQPRPGTPRQLCEPQKPQSEIRPAGRAPGAAVAHAARGLHFHGARAAVRSGQRVDHGAIWQQCNKI
jgi:hypothetical protein